MTSWHSYPQVFALGHRYVSDLFLDPVLCEEKIDGSQFSFGLIDGELKARSKGCQLVVDCPEKMFTKAIDAIKNLDLHPEWTYRGEFLAKPKHNALAYSRVPNNNIIIFDINTAEETYLSYDEKVEEAKRLGFEIVPLLFYGEIHSSEEVMQFLERESILGGQKIEGVVIKNYNRFGQDKKVLMGKFVSEAFKEVHSKEWMKSNPTSKDVIALLINQYRTEARWHKAVQHLRESGTLECSPRDIGNLMKEVMADIEKECADEIKDILYRKAIPNIKRGVTAGLPEWYKEELLKSQFNNVGEANDE